MLIRIAKPSDARQIAKLHHLSNDKRNIGYFSHMRKSFLVKYYKIILNNPYSVVLCAEDDSKKLLGFCSASMLYSSEIQHLKSHWFSLGISAIPSFILKPSLILETISRFCSYQRNDEGYITSEGARGEYWMWTPNDKNSIASIKMNEKHLSLLHLLGVNDLFFEIDADNKNVITFAKINGAIVDRKIQLKDGRERYIMHYNLRNKRRYSF